MLIYKTLFLQTPHNIFSEDEEDARWDIRAAKRQSNWDAYDEKKKQLRKEAFEAKVKAEAEDTEKANLKIEAVYAKARALHGTEKKTGELSIINVILISK